MSNICAGIGRGQMTVVDEHIAHHKHLCGLYRELLADVEGITLHENPSGRYDSNYWLNTVLLDENLHVKGEQKCHPAGRSKSNGCFLREERSPLHLRRGA